MTEVCSSTSGTSVFGMGGQRPQQASMEGVEQRLEQICEHCPNFLLPTVLEGMLEDVLQGVEQDELAGILARLKAVDGPKHRGYRLGLSALEGCVAEGRDAFFRRLQRMSPEQIAAFRAQAE